MERNLRIALLIAIFFLFLFSVIPLKWQQVGDFNFHFQKSGEKCADGYPQSQCDSYYPLLHVIGRLFAFSQHAFSNYLMILLVFVTPMILFFTTKKWFTVWLYFSATQYVYLIQAGGAYPQALAGIFLLLLILFKNPWLKLIVLIIALLSHSQAFVLLLLVWLVQLFFENDLHSMAWKKTKNFFPACSALFGRQEEDPIGVKIAIQTITKEGFSSTQIFLKDIANFFIRIFPFPFLLAAFWQIKKEKQWALLVLTGIFLYYGFALAQQRVFLMIPLILLPSLTRFYEEIPKKWKKWFVIMTLITFTINFGTWILYKVQCLV